MKLWVSCWVVALVTLAKGSSLRDVTAPLSTLLMKRDEILTLRDKAVFENAVEAITQLDQWLDKLSVDIAKESDWVKAFRESKRLEFEEVKANDRLVFKSYAAFCDRSRLVDYYSYYHGHRIALDSTESGEVPMEVVEFMTDRIKSVSVKYLSDDSLNMKDCDSEFGEIFDSFRAELPLSYLSRDTMEFVIQIGVAGVIHEIRGHLAQDQQDMVHHGQDVAMDLVHLDDLLNDL